MVTKGEFETYSKKGLTQAEVARAIGLSRQYVSQLSKRWQIAFRRKSSSLVELVCPTCGAVRRITPSDLAKRKSAFCNKHHLEGLGLSKQGAAASPKTKPNWGREVDDNKS